MKRLSEREARLAGITVAVLLLGSTWMIVRAQLARFSDLGQRALAAKTEARRQQQMLEKRPELIRQLQVVRGQLPRHPEGRDLKSEFARQVQSLSARSGLQLTGLTPEAEERIPDLDLYQSTVRCSWAGSPESLVTFLHLLQQLGAVADIRDLRVRKPERGSRSLEGAFVADFVYARVPPVEMQVVIDTVPNPPNDEVSE